MQSIGDEMFTVHFFNSLQTWDTSEDSSTLSSQQMTYFCWMVTGFLLFGLPWAGL